MILDLFPTENRESTQRDPMGAAVGPAPTLREGWDTAWDHAQYFQNVLAKETARIEAYQRVGDDFYRATGRKVEGPHAPFAKDMLDRSGKYDAYRGIGGRLRQAVDDWNKNNPDRLFLTPPPDEIEHQGESISKDARQAEQELDLRPGSWGGSIGGLAGSMAGAATDLPNIVTMPFGGSSSLLRTFLKETALGAGATTASEAAGFAYKQKIDPTYSVGEAATNVAFGALTQGGIATGIQGLGMGFRRLASSYFKSRGMADRAAADAGNVTMGEALIESRIPQRAAPEVNARQTEMATRAVDDVYAGRPVSETPPDLIAAAGDRYGRVFDADNAAVDVRYEVAELRDLITSHGRDFQENPAFPQELQPRDRSRALSQEQVVNIASNLVPERLGPSMDASTGSPIVGADGIVESGNGRVMALARAYEANGKQAQAYKDYLRTQRFQVDDFEAPVLVARRMSPMDTADRQRFVSAANRSSTLRMSAGEMAMSDAKLLDRGALSKLDRSGVGSAANRDFVREFASRLNRGEQGAIFDKGGALSQDGTRRLQAALTARAYEDPVLMNRLVEDTDSNIKAIGGALTDAAGPMAKLRDAIMRGEVPPHMDLTPDLLDALRLVMRARDEGRPIKEMVAQGDLLFEASPMSATLLRAMFRDDEFKKPISRKALGDMLGDYADEASKVTTDPLMFGDPLSRQDVLQTAVRMSERRDLDGMLAQRLDPETVRETAATPEADAAVVQEAYRMAADPESPRVVMVDFEGQSRPAADVLMELDDMAKAAKELEACATGRAAAE